MTLIAPHIEAFLREYLSQQRGASEHTCDSYAYSFQGLFEFAAGRLRVPPSALRLEQLDATLIAAFLQHLETDRGNSALPALHGTTPQSHRRQPTYRHDLVSAVWHARSTGERRP